MLGACLSFTAKSDAGKEARVGVFMILFILFYSLGQGPGTTHEFHDLIEC